MPEYLAPGAYIEETGTAAKPIAGVVTSTAGFVGAARFGPVSGSPVLVTSFADYQRVFGDGADLSVAGTPSTNHLAWAVRLFFENGGTRLFVARLFNTGAGTLASCTATSADIQTGSGVAHFAARFPGVAGNLQVTCKAQRSGNLRVLQGKTVALSGVHAGDVLEISRVTKQSAVKPRSAAPASPGDPLSTVAAELVIVSFDAAGQAVLTSVKGAVPLAGVVVAQKIILTVTVGSGSGQVDQYPGLSTHPDSDMFIGKMLPEHPAPGTSADRLNRVQLALPIQLPTAPATRARFALGLMRALVDGQAFALSGGLDGAAPQPADYVGSGAGDSATGLLALALEDEIAVVAAPGSASLGTGPARQAVRNALIAHCEALKYRFAVLATELTSDPAVVRAVRAQHDSKYAALYHPWLTVSNATPAAPNATMALSPEGALCGLYAASDTSRGVSKAPANDVVRGVLGFSTAIPKAVQDVLNPEGINCLRFFEGRGNLVWGTRTISSDPEWKYVNVTRLFIYLEHSIDKGTQWAVFEPTGEALWARVRQGAENFLYQIWQSGALMGAKPEQAYYVRCDRTTMTQADIDNGRLICLIGVAPIRPAEFVIFRISQWTADAK